MKNLAVLSLLSLVVVVFLSGCIGQSTPPEGTGIGVIIKDFSPDLVEYSSGEPVSLSLTVQNVGDADATEVKAELFSLNPAEWGGAFSTMSIGTLNKAIPSQQVPGDEYTDEWSLTAPSPSVPTQSYPASVRVSYMYTTEAVASMRFVTSDYIKSLKASEQEAARSSSGLVSSQSSGAPIKVQFTAGTKPFIVYTNDASNPSQFQFQIIITNVGQGSLYDPQSDGGKITTNSRYKLRISAPDIVGDNVGITCNALESRSYVVTLNKGESKTISCTVSASGINNILDGNVKATLTYGYYLDKSTTIKVLKIM